MPAMTSVVITGRRMNNSGTFIRQAPSYGNQIPNPKSQIPIKSQNPNPKRDVLELGFWDLGFPCELGAWCLEFCVSWVRRRPWTRGLHCHLRPFGQPQLAVGDHRF